MTVYTKAKENEAVSSVNNDPEKKTKNDVNKTKHHHFLSEAWQEF